jgi:hypothetical protein
MTAYYFVSYPDRSHPQPNGKLGYFCNIYNRTTDALAFETATYPDQATAEAVAEEIVKELEYLGK